MLNLNESTIALIETNRINHLVKTENGYELVPINIEGLPYVPMILYLTEAKNEKTYKLNYRLLTKHFNIDSTNNEEYIVKDKSNIEINVTNNIPKTPIIYDNQGIITLSKIKGQETVQRYIMRKKRKLFELSHIIDESFDIARTQNDKQKIYKK